MKSLLSLMLGSMSVGGASAWLAYPPAVYGANAPQTSGQSARAQSFIKGLFQKVHVILANKKLNESAKKERVKRLAYQAFDIDHIAQWLLWPTWNSMNEDQRTQFKDISLSYVSDFFFKFAPKYLNDLRIHRVKPLVRNKGSSSPVALEVQAQVTDSESGRHVNVRVHLVNGKIRNMLVENVNLLEAKKKEYRERLRKVQGADGEADVEAFLSQLQDHWKAKRKAKP